MNKNIKKQLLAAVMLATVCAVNAQTTTVSGAVSDLREGTKVELIDIENGRVHIADTLSGEGVFTLKFKQKSIALAELRISNKPEKELQQGEIPAVTRVKFMLEPDVDYTIAASSLSSFSSLHKQKNGGQASVSSIKIDGGMAQSHYREWSDFVSTALAEAVEASDACQMVKYEFDEQGYVKSAKTETRAAAERVAEEKAAVLDSMNRVFVAQHPKYAVSLMLAQQMTAGSAYRYTVAEIDSLKHLFTGNEDSARYNAYCDMLQKMKYVPREAPYTDFWGTLSDGTTVKLSSLMVDGTFTLVDFWASWCGPCRAAIPRVQELRKQYAGRLNVFSVSVDRDEKAWRKAMDEEQMEWTQLWLNKEQDKAATSAYHISAIPYMLLIDPQGRIVYGGHNPQAVAETLKRQL